MADPSGGIEDHSDLIRLAQLAYIYGFPSYEMARLRHQASKHGPAAAHLNTFRHSKILSTPATSGVTAVNSDTLFSVAWLDLSEGPQLIHVPDTADRYYSLALMDFFTGNFAILGRRTTGTTARKFLIVGPQWNDALPKAGQGHVTVLRSPTNSARALIRILVDGPEDLAAARCLQEQFSITRHGQATKKSPPKLLVVPPSLAEQPLRFFDVLNAVLTENPPPARDAIAVAHLRTIGVGPGLKFKRQDFDRTQLNALRKGISSAQEIMRRPGHPRLIADPVLAKLLGRDVPSARMLTAQQRGWNYPPDDIGVFETKYLSRARYALSGFGALPREEAMYFSTTEDVFGIPLQANRRYVVHFPPGGLPPVDAFWSLTVYQTDENKRRWLVPNAINRYSIGDRTPHLRYLPGGALRIYVQHERPVMNEENWLPSPDGPFLLTLRAYQPRRALLAGRYALPQVRPR